MELKTAAIIGAISALVIAIVLYLFILPKSKDGRLGNRFAQAAHNFFNCKYMLIEVIAKFLYVFATFYYIISGFFTMFCKEVVLDGYFDVKTTHMVWDGIKIMILGPIVARFVYELVMLLVMLVKKANSIESKLKDENPDGKKDDIFDLKKETILPPAMVPVGYVPYGTPGYGAPAAPNAPVPPVAPNAPAAPADPNAPVVIGYDVNTGAPIYGKKQ